MVIQKIAENKTICRNDVIEIISGLCQEYSDILGRVILFGSYSRGDGTEGSDIDLYIEPLDRMTTTGRYGTNRRYREFKYTLHEMIPLRFDMLAYGGKRELERMKKALCGNRLKRMGWCFMTKEQKQYKA